jgi:hypothetical protein
MPHLPGGHGLGGTDIGMLNQSELKLIICLNLARIAPTEHDETNRLILS